MIRKFIGLLIAFCALFIVFNQALPVSAQEDDATMAYANGLNDMSVKIVAVIYNYSGMVWEAFDGKTLDGDNAQLELDYVKDVLNGASDTIAGILDKTDKSSPVYSILSPHLDCYSYFFDYMDALDTYFGDPTDDNLDAVYNARTAVEQYMKAIGLVISTRGGDDSGGDQAGT